MRMPIFFSGLGLICVLGWGCGSSEPSCVLPPPSAVFSPKMAGVSQHKFEAKGLESSEELVLSDLAMRMEILQSGCEEAYQEFRMELDGTVNEVRTAAQTVQLIADIFGNISELDKGQLRGFMDLAQLLHGNYMSFNEFGEAVPLSTEDGRLVTVAVNKTAEPKRTFLTLTLRVR